MNKLLIVCVIAGCALPAQAQVMQLVGEPGNQAFRLDFECIGNQRKRFQRNIGFADRKNAFQTITNPFRVDV